MQIRGVFFDMGGTIETFTTSPQIQREAVAGLQRMLAEKDIDPGYSFEQLFQLITSGLDRYHAWDRETMLELPPWRVWREYLLPNCDIDAEKLAAASEELMTYLELHYYPRALRPEVPGVLAEIRRMGCKIGLISNVNSRGQVPFNLKKYGISRYFDPVVLSSEYGRRKPDPAIFLHAARLAHLPASALLYVGDRIARDVLGAKEAGYKMAVQIAHEFDHGENDSGAEPDAVITSMTELLDILRADRQSAGLKAVCCDNGKPCALLFDAGDILYHRPRRRIKLKAFLNAHGRELSDLDESARKAFELQAFQGQITQDEYRQAVIGCYGIHDPELVREGAQIIREEDNDLDIFAGVPETLHALKDRGYLLGIITDTAASVSEKLRWFKIGGFGDVWDAVISSAEIGVRKPHPDIYKAALDQLGVTAKQAVFVGHKPVELDGAHQVGMTTAAFNPDPGAQADYFVEHFSDLLKLPVLQTEILAEEK